MRHRKKQLFLLETEHQWRPCGVATTAAIAAERSDSRMCLPTSRPASIFCILPPHILREIAQNGTPQQRRAALHTLTTDQTFRALRAAQPSIAPTARRRPAVLAAEGQKQRTIYDTHNTQNLPGEAVRTEGAPPSDDVAVNEAYDGLGATFDLYWEAYER